MQRLGIVSWTFLVAALGACGGGGDDTLTLDGLPAAVEETLCELWVRCGVAPDRAGCEAALFYPVGFPPLEAAAAAGRIVFDADAATACLAAVEAADCEADGFDVLATEPCQAMLHGAIPAGDPCFLGVECQSGQCLYAPNCTSQCCEGICAAVVEPIPVGEPCVLGTTPCVEGAHCEENPGSSACVLDKGEGEPCANFDSCASGLYCDFVTSTMSLCTPRPSEGEYCKLSGSAYCATVDLYCDATEERCRKRAAVGESCAGFIACVPHAFCDPTSGQCAPARQEGEPCDTDHPCLFDHLTCVSGTCTAPAPPPACP